MRICYDFLETSVHMLWFLQHLCSNVVTTFVFMGLLLQTSIVSKFCGAYNSYGYNQIRPCASSSLQVCWTHLSFVFVCKGGQYLGWSMIFWGWICRIRPPTLCEGTVCNANRNKHLEQIGFSNVFAHKEIIMEKKKK